MKKIILDIINEFGTEYFSKIPETASDNYRLMLYCGMRLSIDKAPAESVLHEAGCSEADLMEMIRRWNFCLEEGDILLHNSVAAYNNCKGKRYCEAKKIHYLGEGKVGLLDADTYTAMPHMNPKEMALPGTMNVDWEPEPCKGRWCLGFWISEEDERREREAIRSSILFMAKFGAGRPPRMNGEYFTPGCNPAESKLDNRQFLPLTSAAHYCGCPKNIIEEAARKGIIERRAYKHSDTRTFYEYLIDDLDRFIKSKTELKTNQDDN